MLTRRRRQAVTRRLRLTRFKHVSFIRQKRQRGHRHSLPHRPFVQNGKPVNALCFAACAALYHILYSVQFHGLNVESALVYKSGHLRRIQSPRTCLTKRPFTFLTNIPRPFSFSLSFFSFSFLLSLQRYVLSRLKPPSLCILSVSIHPWPAASF